MEGKGITLNSDLDINFEERVIQRGSNLELAVNRIVDGHLGDLTKQIHIIRELIKDKSTILSNQEIEDILLYLPIILYDVTDSQELVGLQYDFADQIYKESYNEAYRIAKGTVKDKDSEAELKTMIEKLDKIIFDRAYKIIKQKISMAIETLNAIKKVQSMRQESGNLGKFIDKF